ncbi:hypothetical protein [Synechococcus sp. WH 8109]|nr:hypothetical protein [Synechococcus sp. WH 8109]
MPSDSPRRLARAVATKAITSLLLRLSPKSAAFARSGVIPLVGVI